MFSVVETLMGLSEEFLMLNLTQRMFSVALELSKSQAILTLLTKSFLLNGYVRDKLQKEASMEDHRSCQMFATLGGFILLSV